MNYAKSPRHPFVMSLVMAVSLDLGYGWLVYRSQAMVWQ